MKQEKSEKIYDGVTEIRDDVIQRADRHRFRSRKKSPVKKWLGPIAAVLVVAVVTGILLAPGTSPFSGNVSALAAPQYPDMAQYPLEEDFTDSSGEFDSDGYMQAYDLWWQSQRQQYAQDEGYADNLDAFLTRSIGQFLSGSGDENRVYSPLNVYLALAMLAELTDQNSRQQILDLLGADSIDALRQQATALWNANYRDDGISTSLLASSLWLNEDVSFNQETLDRLAQVYYAASYQGQMGSDAMDRALRDWLNEQTGGLLEEQTGNLELREQTVLALATTIYFRAKWSDEFSNGATQPDTFHAVSGDQTCDFMHQSNSREYYWGDSFSAVGQSLNGSGSMWFLLPDEGVSVDVLLQDAQAMEFILSGGRWENSKYLTVNLSVPKFDVTSSIDLIEGLQALGVTDVFDTAKADFSPMGQNVDNVSVSQAQHDTRVMIDEEGCIATAYTVMAADATGAQEAWEEVDFVLDRPFVFVITNRDGLPLFAGVVNQVQ